ncbi:MAG: Cysteine ase [Lasallia pustulata]|uniref:Cysteine ase n=1 Tax=Lasallia pustulata TaxID=136370 RepID=A0A5M8Q1V7_9LECA|nr:MAG: Cysteine ase [Lasallia pustulata]
MINKNPSTNGTNFQSRLQSAESRIHQATSKDDALTAALDAIELCMRALRLKPSDDEKGRLDQTCRRLLERAELIKATGQWKSEATDIGSRLPRGGSPQASQLKLKEPISTRTLSTREQIILLEGSKLHGFTFWPWKSNPLATEFEMKPGENLFLDEPELRLSHVQMGIFDGWQRPRDVLPPARFRDAVEKADAGPQMIASGKVDLVQDMTTDCSVVASLCAGTARAERGHARIISSIIHPYDHENQTPAISPNGKYIFKLHFNGCDRKVVIDDRLPASRTARTLHVIDRSNPSLLYPALIEKAYLKTRGGYDFPGSNSGTDLWVLTAWVPEQVFLQNDDIVPNSLWRRIFNAFNYGDVLVTMGTGKLARIEEEGLGLAGEHDYAVIDMKEIGDRRLFLVKNPWLDGTTWKGRLVGDDRHEARESATGLGAASGSEDTPSNSNPMTPGTFWMDLSSVFQSFESIYLNWNPVLFSFRQDIHFTWDLSISTSPEGCFRQNPQYAVKSSNGGTAWILLSKHFQDKSLKMVDKSAESSKPEAFEPGFISLYAFDNGGKLVYLSDGALVCGPYVDSPNTLLRTELPPGSAYTIVVSQQALAHSSHNFTLSVLSLKPVDLTPASEKYGHCTTYDGAWTFSTSGGNASCSTYQTNPQFSIKLSKGSDIALLLETTAEGLAVHIKLVWANGKRATGVTARDIVGDSGEYRRGCALAELRDIDAGTYTIICSTFEPGQLGKFKLHVSTTAACLVKPLPLEEAGRLVTRPPLATFSPGVDRLLAPLTTHRITRLRMLATHCSTQPGARLPLKLALEYGQGPNKQILTVSCNDEFSGDHAGVRTQDVDVLPRMCEAGGIWIVLERMGGSGLMSVEGVLIELLSEFPVEVGSWGTGAG